MKYILIILAALTLSCGESPMESSPTQEVGYYDEDCPTGCLKWTANGMRCVPCETDTTNTENRNENQSS